MSAPQLLKCNSTYFSGIFDSQPSYANSQDVIPPTCNTNQFLPTYQPIQMPRFSMYEEYMKLPPLNAKEQTPTTVSKSPTKTASKSDKVAAPLTSVCEIVDQVSNTLYHKMESKLKTIRNSQIENHAQIQEGMAKLHQDISVLEQKVKENHTDAGSSLGKVTETLEALKESHDDMVTTIHQEKKNWSTMLEEQQTLQGNMEQLEHSTAHSLQAIQQTHRQQTLALESNQIVSNSREVIPAQSVEQVFSSRKQRSLLDLEPQRSHYDLETPPRMITNRVTRQSTRRVGNLSNYEKASLTGMAFSAKRSAGQQSSIFSNKRQQNQQTNHAVSRRQSKRNVTRQKGEYTQSINIHLERRKVHVDSAPPSNESSPALSLSDLLRFR